MGSTVPKTYVPEQLLSSPLDLPSVEGSIPETISEDAQDLVVGRQDNLCVSGTSTGIRNIVWKMEGADRITACDITGLFTCSKMKCANCRKAFLERLPSALQALNGSCSSHQGKTAYYLTSYSGHPIYVCASVPDKYLSFLVVEAVQPDDAGDYTVSITSVYHNTYQVQFSTHPGIKYHVHSP